MSNSDDDSVFDSSEDDGEGHAVDLREIAEEAERETINERREASDNLAKARSECRHRDAEAVRCGLRTHPRFGGARDHVLNNRGRQPGNNVFAHDIPTLGSPGSSELAYSKGYFTGSYPCAYRYLSSTSLYQDGCLMDEMVPGDIPTRLFFDLELKRFFAQHGSGSSPTTESMVSGVLRAHVAAVCEYSTVSASEELIHDLARQHMRVRGLELTEEECVAGCDIMREFIAMTLAVLLGRDVHGTDEPTTHMAVTSRCRRDKFSLHVVMTQVFSDRVSRSMPLVVFELARAFTMFNTTRLLTAGFPSQFWSSPAGTFHLRCLMVSSMQDDQHRFKGYNDTIFDEGVYSAGHLLAAPGTVKAGQDLPLSPVGGDRPLMVKSTPFRLLFPLASEWRKFTIAGSGNPMTQAFDDLPYLLSGWTTRGCYPRKHAHAAAARNHYYRESEHRTSFHLVPEKGKPRYRELRPTALRPLTPEEVSRHSERLSFANTLQGAISVTDEFRSRSTHVLTPFHLLEAGEMVYHRHDGHTEEQTASAKVVHTSRSRGVHCWRCDTFFVATDFAPPESLRVEEPRYPFLPSETRHAIVLPTGGVHPYIGGPARGQNHVQWRSFLYERKFIVIDAPMGSGKTQELARLGWLIEQEARKKKPQTVLVVTFRVSLATQLAVRLSMRDYKVTTTDRFTQEQLNAMIRAGEFDKLVICLNSLMKVGDKKFDVLILDECGLIRRYFVSRVMTSVLAGVWKKFIRLVQSARNVIMCQDYVSQADVGFYTGLDDVDPTNRAEVRAFRFVKPIVIHPIKISNNFAASIHQLLESYDDAFDDDGTCTQPFMVLGTKVHMCAFFIHLLTERCNSKLHWSAEVRARNASRIKGLWRDLVPSSRYAREFLQDPNAKSSEADVLVATPIIGAGFSINTHFVAFHGFFFKNVINHWLQRQFMGRVRLLIDELPPDAVRTSYLYCDEDANHPALGNATADGIRDVFQAVRREIMVAAQDTTTFSSIASSHLQPLDEAHAQVMLEDDVSSERNYALMMEYGTETLDSSFDELNLQIDATREAFLRNACRDFVKDFKRDIGDKVSRTMYDDTSREVEMEDLDYVSSLDSRELMVAAGATVIVGDWQDNYHSAIVAKAILRQRFPPGPKGESDFSKAVKSPQIVAMASRRLVCWLLYMYRTLGDVESGCMVMDYYASRLYSSVMRNASGLLVASWVLPDLLGGAAGAACVVATGATPFYTGAQVKRYCPSLSEYWKEKFAKRSGEGAERRAMRTYLLCVLGKGATEYSNAYKDLFSWTTSYDPNSKNAPFDLLKTLCKAIGLPLRSTGSRGPHSVEVKVKHDDGVKRTVWSIDLTDVDIALALLYKSDLVARLKSVLPALIQTENTDIAGAEKLRASYKLYCNAIDASVPVDNNNTATTLMPEKARLLRFKIPQVVFPGRDGPPVIDARRKEMMMEETARDMRERDGAHVNDRGEVYGNGAHMAVRRAHNEVSRQTARERLPAQPSSQRPRRRSRRPKRPLPEG